MRFWVVIKLAEHIFLNSQYNLLAIYLAGFSANLRIVKLRLMNRLYKDITLRVFLFFAFFGHLHLLLTLPRLWKVEIIKTQNFFAGNYKYFFSKCEISKYFVNYNNTWSFFSFLELWAFILNITKVLFRKSCFKNCQTWKSLSNNSYFCGTERAIRVECSIFSQ